MEDNVIGSEVAPKNIMVSLSEIMKLPVERNCDWCVYAYALNSDIINENGKIEDFRGLIFPLGCFNNLKKAENHAKKVIELTGYQNVVIAKYGLPIPMSTNPSRENIEILTVDQKGTIIELESQAYKRNIEAYNKKVKLEKEMMDELNDELNEDSLEYYKRLVYLTLQHNMNYNKSLKEMGEYLKNYEKRKNLLQEHLKRHPEHKDQLLPFLKEKLENRGEEELYMRLETSYIELKDKLLL